jgi:hypothetical protein
MTQPSNTLKQFGLVTLKPGQSKEVSFTFGPDYLKKIGWKYGMGG